MAVIVVVAVIKIVAEVTVNVEAVVMTAWW